MYLVVGMFNGAPGAQFLSEFSNAVAAGTSISVDLAQGLTETSQFKDIYPDFQTSQEFATSFANNVLGNTVTDANKDSAIATIKAALDAGQSKSSVMASAITALAATDPNDANWGNARKALDNKVDVATWFSVEKAVATEDVAELQAILSTVTEDEATATSAKDDKNLPGVTESFTTNLDSLKGGSGSDQFNGVINTTDGTIQVGDSIDGGSSYDTLRVVSVTSGLDSSVTSISNIEEIIITESGTGPKTHNLSSVAGLEQLSLNTPASDASTTTIEGIATSTGLSIIGQTDGDVAVNYSDAAETGDQTAKITLQGAQNGNLAVDGIERVELTTDGAGSATSDFTFDAATYISIKGTTDLTSTISTSAADATLELEGAAKVILGTLDNDIDTVTAALNTGGVELTLDADKDTQVTLGTGDDTVTTATAYAVIATDTALIAAGEGTDTLVVKDTTHLSTAGHFTGFETLVVENGVSADLDNIAGITALTIDDGAGATGATNLDATVAGNITLKAAAGDLVIGVKGANTINQVDTVKITVDDGESTDSTATVTSLEMADVEILDIVAVDNASFTFSEANNNGLNSVKLSGAGDITIVTGDLATSNMMIDGSTATGDLTIDGGINTDSITLGSGSDTVTQEYGDSIAASASSFAGANLAAGDTLTFGNGVDVVNGFTAGANGDMLDTDSGTNASTGIGETIATGFVSGQTYFVSGDYNSDTGLFTTTADGAGSDTLVYEGLNATALNINTSAVVLVGVDSDDLVAANFM